MTARGDLLIRDLGGSNSNEVANELLKEFQKGYPIEELRALLKSDNDVIVKNASWLASELGVKATPVFDAVLPNLKHGLAYARFFAIDVVAVCAGSKDGIAVASVVSMLEDSDKAVRWKAICFLANASKEQILSSHEYLADDRLKELVSWMIGVESNGDTAIQQIMEKLSSGDSLERKFSAAASARLSEIYPEALNGAAQSSDDEVSSFALDFRKTRRL